MLLYIFFLEGLRIRSRKTLKPAAYPIVDAFLSVGRWTQLFYLKKFANVKEGKIVNCYINI